MPRLPVPRRREILRVEGHEMLALRYAFIPSIVTCVFVGCAGGDTGAQGSPGSTGGASGASATGGAKGIGGRGGSGVAGRGGTSAAGTGGTAGTGTGTGGTVGVGQDASLDATDATDATDALDGFAVDRSTGRPLYCPVADASTDGSSTAADANLGVIDCQGWRGCNGYALFQAGFYDPCRPMHCAPPQAGLPGWCAPLLATEYVPDGTPCDDGDPSSFAGPGSCVTDGDCPHSGTPTCAGGDRDGRSCATDDDCTPNRAGPCRPTCAGGINAGNACNLDADCPSSDCSTATKKCNLGANRGNVCRTNSDCGALVDYNAMGISGCDRFCKGGAAPASPLSYCQATAECSALYGSSSLCCPGGGIACNAGGGSKRCNGGLLDGQICKYPSDCVEAKCAKWSCDTTPGRGYCVAQNGIPSCPNGQSDCDLTPYNKFCSLDPDYQGQAWAAGTLADPACGTDGAACPNTCNDGTIDWGPVVSYACNTTTHQCLNASVPCPGGATGAGSVCNNVCRAGRCSSDFASCR